MCVNFCCLCTEKSRKVCRSVFFGRFALLHFLLFFEQCIDREHGQKVTIFFTSSVNSGHVTMTSQKSTFKQSVLYARAITLHKKQVSLVFHAKFDTNCENWCLHLIVFFHSLLFSLCRLFDTGTNCL